MVDRVRGRAVVVVVVVVVGALLSAACAGGSTPRSADVDRGPAPSAMCATGQDPAVAAYGLEDGEFRWATCETGGEMYVATAASTDDVWVERLGATREMLRIDARTGEIVGRGVAANYPGDVPDGADVRRTSPPSTASVFVRGGQDDPLEGVDTATDEIVWTADGFPIYDDVWAADDEAVYVSSGDATGSWLVAYSIDTGEVRWKVDAAPVLGMPWHADDGRVYVMASDLHVLSAVDGSVLWSTDFADVTAYPRPFGAVANDDLVFLSFTMRASDGD